MVIEIKFKGNSIFIQNGMREEKDYLMVWGSLMDVDVDGDELENYPSRYTYSKPTNALEFSSRNNPLMLTFPGEVTINCSVTDEDRVQGAVEFESLNVAIIAEVVNIESDILINCSVFASKVNVSSNRLVSNFAIYGAEIMVPEEFNGIFLGIEDNCSIKCGSNTINPNEYGEDIILIGHNKNVSVILINRGLLKVMLTTSHKSVIAHHRFDIRDIQDIITDLMVKGMTDELRRVNRADCLKSGDIIVDPSTMVVSMIKVI